MPHPRQRILESILKKTAAWSPITGLIGARQTGKTTALRRLSEQYLNFDDSLLEAKFENSGRLLLDQAKKPLFLDEVQKYPKIFDLLKMVVDENRKPNQYLITGSVRFSSKKQIRESLTGRAIIWEMLPLTLSECHEKPFKDLIAMTNKKVSLEKLKDEFKKKNWCKPKDAFHYQETGGMPGFCFLRDPQQRSIAIANYLDALLGRDFAMLRETTIKPYLLVELLRLIAENQGQPLNYSVLARKIKVSVPTIKSTLNVFEGLFLLRSHGKTAFLEDIGVAATLMPNSPSTKITRLEQWVFSELRAQTLYHREHQTVLTAHSTRGGAHIPFVLKPRNGKAVAITIDADETMSEKSMKSLYAFQRTHSNALLINIHLGTEAYLHKNRILSMPWTWLV